MSAAGRRRWLGRAALGAAGLAAVARTVPASRAVPHAASDLPDPALVAALRAVLDLHRDAGPSQGYGANFKGGYGEYAHCCGTCGAHGEYGVEWPCPTVQTIADALGVEP